MATKDLYIATPEAIPVTKTQDWSLSLTNEGAIVQDYDDVNQCILIILGTARGSNALRPTFGSEIWRYIDYPANQGIPIIKKLILDAVKEWEPRATITRITHTLEANAKCTFNIEWIFNVTGQTKTTEFGINFVQAV